MIKVTVEKKQEARSVKAGNWQCDLFDIGASTIGRYIMFLSFKLFKILFNIIYYYTNYCSQIKSSNLWFNLALLCICFSSSEIIHFAQQNLLSNTAIIRYFTIFMKTKNLN